MENSAIGCIKSSSSTTTATKPSPPITTKASPPPPLMPRMPITSQGPNATISSKLRCNSKASYLPRQSLEKLNNSDPDHGSYKLTLTSNEDLVATNTKPNAYDILTHNGKMPTNNLPDVLPLGAKLQPQSASPTSANNHTPLRTGSNNNLSTMHSPTQQQAGHCYPMYPPMQHRYSTPAPSSNSYNSSRGTHTPSYTRSQSFNANASSASPTKFMSQSTIDLKKTHHLETTQEETLSDTAKVLSPAQSESNLSSPTKSKPLSPCSARREFHRSNDYGGQMGADEQRTEVSEGRIFRAEPISTTFPPTSPCGGTVHKSVTRKDSLRENIEKITQLQSKLMSAHLSDSCGLLSGFGTPTSALSPTAKPTDETMKPASQKSDNITEMSETGTGTGHLSTAAQTAHSSMADDTPMPPLPQTPPPQSAENHKSTEEVNAMAASQIYQMDSSTDGLKLMQRSEIILRVNPSTVETASQTDDLLDSDLGLGLTVNHNAKEDAPTRTTLQPRQRHPIEIDCDNMSQELASLLSPNDKLIEILTPQTIKTPADYVSNLYNPEVPLRPAKRDVGTSTLMRMKMRESSQESSDKSAVVMELQYAEIEVSLMNGNESDSCDLMKKKVDELIKHLNRKIRILNNEQTTIGEESALNDELGSVLIDKLAEKVRPIEATKFRTYIDDVGHITSLLLSLSERLARSENGLSTIGDNSAEKKTLETKRDRLLEQLEEAKRLKEDIDRRGACVTGMLEKNLSSDAFADFDYFINMKAKLIADTRDIADKIKCGEEQLSALSEALIQSDC